MPLQNRVTPFSVIGATSARGLLMGNRGILHDEHKRLGPTRWRHPHWITCALSFKGRHRRVMAPDYYTELFLCDEAVGLAAGHRPCAECRRADYNRFLAAWRAVHDIAEEQALRAGDIDKVLHRARVTRDRKQVRYSGRAKDLPDGTFIAVGDEPGAACLIWGDRLHQWSHEGYTAGPSLPPEREVIVLTPEPTVRVLRAGYQPMVHPTVGS